MCIRDSRKIEEGDIIEGTVIGVTESEVILDLKYYTCLLYTSRCV